MEEIGHQLDKRLKMMDEQINAIKEIATDMGELMDIMEAIPLEKGIPVLEYYKEELLDYQVNKD